MTPNPVGLKLVRSGLLSAIGYNATWTAPAIKRIQLVGGVLFVKADTTTAAGAEATLWDSTASPNKLMTLGTLSVGAPGNLMNSMRFTLPGDGYVQKADAGSLGCNLDAACSTGGVYLSLWGYEI